MFIAFNGGVRPGDTPGVGEVLISEVQYEAAVAGMLDGKQVSVVEGELVVDFPPEPQPDPEPQKPLNPQIVAIAALQVNVAEGLIDGIETACGLAVAFPIDVGVYWVFFNEPQPDMSYTWNVGASSGTIGVSLRDLTMMELRAYEGANPADPAEISIQVFRVS